MIGSVASRYRLVRPIGHGAHGTVYEAHDERLGRTVAVKLLRSGSPLPASAGRAFLREARMAAAAGPAAVTVHDVVVGDDGAAIVMELVPRGPISTALASPDARRLTALVTSMVDGLATVHRLGVLHLDIHPANVLVRDDDTVAFTDFGMAQLARTAGHSAGARDPDWVAPEVLRGDAATAAADVYSIGLILALIDRREPIGLGGLAKACLQDEPSRRPADGTELQRMLASTRVAATAVRP